MSLSKFPNNLALLFRAKQFVDDRAGRIVLTGTRILIMGDTGLVRLALRQLLSSAEDIVVTGEVGIGAEATGFAAKAAPIHVVLVDVPQTNEFVLNSLRELRIVVPQARAIILSNESLGAFRMAELGIWGILPRDVSPGELLRAVREVARGNAVLDCILSLEQFTRLDALRPPGAARALPLSPREQSVIREMASGRTDNQIAHELGLSLPTVKTHVRSILKKTRSRNRAAAIAAAFRHGVIS